MTALEALRFHVVGYGCTTCIGNSGPLPEGGLARDRRRPAGRGRRALGQPQLRGADQPRGARQLPGLAAAGGRLRARRPHRPRPHDRAARHRPRRPAGLPARDLAEPGRDRGGAAPGAAAPSMFRRQYADVFAGDPEWQALPVPEGETYAWDAGVDLRAPAALLRRHAGDAARRSRRRGRPRASPCSATRSPPTTSRPPARSRRTARPAATWSSTASRPPTSTPTARAAATTR